MDTKSMTEISPESMSVPEPSRLEVLRPGMDTWIVDPGRFGFRDRGVGPGGPADSFSFDLAHALLGNDPGLAMIEFSLIGPVLVCGGAPLVAVVTGAVDSCLLSPGENAPPVEIPPEKTFMWQPGQTLRTGPMSRGARGYLAVAGGIESPLLLGSRLGFRPVQANEMFPCPGGKAPLRQPSERVWQAPLGTLRVLPGPEANQWPANALFDQTWKISQQANRMGIRLEGYPLKRDCDREMLSEPVLPGTIQINNSGLPMILGVGAQTIGGYPRIGMVIRADLDALGQFRPGDSVRFLPVNEREALLAREFESARRSLWIDRLRGWNRPIG